MRIDVHAHWFPKSYVDHLVGLGWAGPPMAGQAEDLAPRIEQLDLAGVDVQILSAVGLDTQIAERGPAVDAARFINDLYCETERATGGRLRSFAWLPLPHVDDAVKEAARALDDLGATGIAMPCFYQGRPLDDPAFEPVWQALDERAAIVYIHPVGQHSACHPGLDEFGLHTAYGSPMQLTTAATRLVYKGVPQRHRNIRFVFAVCGGMLPYWWERIRRNLERGFTGSADAAVGAMFTRWIRDLPIDAADPMAEFRRFYYDTSVQDVPAAMLTVKQSYGVDRLLLGSDEIFASVTEVVRYIETNEYLTDEEKHAILDVNAQRLLQLSPGS